MPIAYRQLYKLQNEKGETMRLQKYMAMCGVAARRKCEKVIADGHVTVNGCRVNRIGVQVQEGDRVELDGKLLIPQTCMRYILYYKPMGEVATVNDDKDRSTVMDRFRDLPERIYPVGRLDYDSEGLLLLTNDGELAQRLTHPSREVDKVYLARVSGIPNAEALERLRRGVYMEGDMRKTYPARLRVVRDDAFSSDILITIHEGRNRQVRRMFEAVGHRVLLLRRVRFGPLSLDGLRRGEWRELTRQEIDNLRAL